MLSRRDADSSDSAAMCSSCKQPQQVFGLPAWTSKTSEDLANVKFSLSARDRISFIDRSRQKAKHMIDRLKGAKRSDVETVRFGLAGLRSSVSSLFLRPFKKTERVHPDCDVESYRILSELSFSVHIKGPEYDLYELTLADPEMSGNTIASVIVGIGFYPKKLRAVRIEPSVLREDRLCMLKNGQWDLYNACLRSDGVLTLALFSHPVMQTSDPDNCQKKGPIATVALHSQVQRVYKPHPDRLLIANSFVLELRGLEDMLFHASDPPSAQAWIRLLQTMAGTV